MWSMCPAALGATHSESPSPAIQHGLPGTATGSPTAPVAGSIGATVSSPSNDTQTRPPARARSHGPSPTTIVSGRGPGSVVVVASCPPLVVDGPETLGGTAVGGVSVPTLSPDVHPGTHVTARTTAVMLRRWRTAATLSQLGG